MEDEKQTNDTDAVDEASTVRADEPKICAICEMEINTREWHPLVTRTDDDGRFHVYAFCSEECRDEWPDTDSGAASGGG